MLIYVKIIKINFFNHKNNFFLIYVNFMLICANLCKYHRQADRRTDKHIKSIVRNLTKLLLTGDA